ncbi:L,D-transpeptidase [Nitrospira sp. M1]
MYRVLRWIDRTDWRMVTALAFMSSLTLSLVFAGPLNTSSDGVKVGEGTPGQQTAYKVKSDGQTSVLSIQSKSLSHASEAQRSGTRGYAPPVSPTTETSEDISLLLDLSKNLLMVKRGSVVIHTALAATGSGKVLHDPHNPSRTWKFETPKGNFTIQSKLEKPVWIRPDWAFIEKGAVVPEDPDARLLPNALGDYALGFGDGYFIHGALYTYLLGFNVTHGCIQLNDDDLRYIFETVPLGATLVIV